MLPLLGALAAPIIESVITRGATGAAHDVAGMAGSLMPFGAPAPQSIAHGVLGILSNVMQKLL
jgi:hypothetical protein